jgi:2'-5' RNA ligase
VTPDGMPVEERPVIVTARLDPEDLAPYERLRREHFPSERNVLPAHLTMFHALPGAAFPRILAALEDCVRHHRRFEAQTVGLRLFGGGVAFDVESAQLAGIRSQLRGEFASILSAQDARPWRPHITVQNKVASRDARRLHAQLLATFERDSLRVTGVDCWRYLGGPWELLASLRFSDKSD